MASNPVVRFAPSPTGLLPVGNVRAALFNWLAKLLPLIGRAKASARLSGQRG
jgi:hypothetical protein